MEQSRYGVRPSCDDTMMQGGIWHCCDQRWHLLAIRRKAVLSPKGRESPSGWAGSVGSAPEIPSAASEPLFHSRPGRVRRLFGSLFAVPRISVESGWPGDIRGGGYGALSLQSCLLIFRELEGQVREAQLFGGIEAGIAVGKAAGMIVGESDVALAVINWH